MSTTSAFNRRSVITTMAVSGAALVGSGIVALPAPRDPVFDTIEAHRQSLLAYSAALYVDDGDGPDVERTGDAEMVATDALAAAVPETTEGALALLRYVVGYYEGSHEWSARHELFGDKDQFVSLLSGITQFLEA